VNRSRVTFLLAGALGVASATRVCAASLPISQDSAATSGYELAIAGVASDSAGIRTSEPRPVSVDSRLVTAAMPNRYDHIPTRQDSARRMWVRFTLMQFDEVRILTPEEKIEVRHPLATSDGFLIRDDAIAGWNSLTADPRKPRTVRWDEIEKIQARKHGGGWAILLGGLAGLAVGLSISMALAFDSTFSLASGGDSAAPVVLGILGGGALGALVDRPGPWETVYP